MRIKRGYVAVPAGLQIHYRMTEPKREGVPLVLLHQTASSSVMFERMMGLLGDDFWVVAPDTPGFGGSDGVPGRVTIPAYTQAIYSALQALGITACYVFGHHTGASIGVQLATEWPGLVRKLALYGAPVLTEAQKVGLGKTLVEGVIRPGGEHLSGIWQRIHKKAGSAPLELINRETLLNLQAVGYQEAYTAVFEHDFAERLAAVGCPTLLMAGENDSLRASFEPAQRLLPQAQTVLIEGADSYVCDLRPGVMVGVLRGFFCNW